MDEKQSNWEELGFKLREAREAKGISLRQMAKDLSISVSFLSEIERGIKRCPDDGIISISKYLDANLDEMFIAAGRIPPNVIQALKENTKIQDLVREVSGFLNEEEVDDLVNMIYKLRENKCKFPIRDCKCREE